LFPDVAYIVARERRSELPQPVGGVLNVFWIERRAFAVLGFGLRRAGGHEFGNGLRKRLAAHHGHGSDVSLDGLTQRTLAQQLRGMDVMSDSLQPGDSAPRVPTVGVEGVPDCEGVGDFFGR